MTATSQIIPAGYEAKQSKDGGVTWNTVPDQDAFIFALYNGAVYDQYAVLSGMTFVQVSSDRGANFSWSVGAKAGGEIVRKVMDANGAPTGFAILGETEDGSVNGYITSLSHGAAGTWKDVNIQWADPEMLSIDGSFLNSTYTVVGNVYITQAADVKRGEGRRRRASRRAQARGGKATYATEVVTSSDGGSTWTTVFSNDTVSALGVACIDAAHCCFVGEDADAAYIFCAMDGKTYSRVLADTIDGAALVEIAVAPGTCAGGGPAYIAVGGYVDGAGQAPVFYRSCDMGNTWAKDALPSWPVANLLVTDIDCQPAAPGGTACFSTLWDDGGSTSSPQQLNASRSRRT